MSELRDCAGHSHYQLPPIWLHRFGAALGGCTSEWCYNQLTNY